MTYAPLTISRRLALALPLAALPSQALARDGVSDAAFAALGARYLDTMARLSPTTATVWGDHRFDREIEDVSAAGRALRLSTLKALLAEANGLAVASLNRNNQVDHALMRHQLRYDIWQIEVLQDWAWDPQIYNGIAGGALYGLMARDFAPLEERLRSAMARMEKLPTLLAQARQVLQVSRVPRVHAETVSRQNAGLNSLVDGLILVHADQLSPADRAALQAAATKLKAAVAEHQKWLDTVLVPGAKGDFRLDAALYDQKLAFALASTLSREEIRARAEQALRDARSEMYAIARAELTRRGGSGLALPEAPTAAQQQAAIEAALEIVYADRAPRNGLVEASREGVRVATTFLEKADVITLPDAPVQVILMPEFQRGVAVAYCDPPGPLERHLPTFYAVSPIPDEWSDEQATSFLKEYNRRGVTDIAVHEAMPGHFVQLWHSNRHPSVLRAVLWSGTFVEGWAVYAEDMMVKSGFMANDPLYRLQVLKTRVRTITNAILDQMVHVDGASREDVIAFLTGTAFQQEREAAGKWTRACLSSAQLPSYFVGVAEHDAVRAEAETRWGSGFTLKRYHDTVLSHGSPPMRYVRALMFEEPVEA